MGAGMIALLGLIDTFKEEKELDPFKTFFPKVSSVWVKRLSYQLAWLRK